MTLSTATPRSRFKTVLLLATILLPIAIPIAYQWYSERVALEVQIWSQSSLVQPPGGLEKLEVMWDGTPVKGISRIEVAVVNTGWKAIRTPDIVAPIRVLLDSGEILEVRGDSVQSGDVAVRFKIDSSRRSVTVDAPLLNRHDAVRFTILTNVTPPPRLIPTARVTDMRSLTVTDRRLASRPVWRKLGWSFYVALAGTIGAFLAFSIFLYGIAYFRAVRHRWAMRPGYAPTTIEYRQLMGWVFGPEMFEGEDIRAALEGTDPNKPLTAEQAKLLQATVGKRIRDSRVRGHWTTLVLLVFFVIGLVYVVLSFARVAGG